MADDLASSLHSCRRTTLLSIAMARYARFARAEGKAFAAVPLALWFSGKIRGPIRLPSHAA